ncbi:hypothetical protein INR49_023990 [Caranx melampygus]|nr:hypothetical protein INR49_023990 [Caranx melampygus]
MAANYCQIKQCTFWPASLSSLQGGKPLHCSNIHHWMVNTVQRSPFLKDIILTTGGWHFSIWKEEVMDDPIIISPSFEQQCTTGCWSLSRPAVFFIGKNDGTIDVWNLLENSIEPAHIQTGVTNTKITCIKPWTYSSKQHFLAVSDDLGMVRVFEIPRTFSVPSKTELLSMKKYFEKEEDALKDYLKREEMWVKEKKEAEELKKKMEVDKSAQSLKEDEERKLYDEYLLLEESLLKSMGLLSPAAET